MHLTAVYLQNEPPASSFVKEDVAVDTDGHFSPAEKNANECRNITWIDAKLSLESNRCMYQAVALFSVKHSSFSGKEKP